MDLTIARRRARIWLGEVVGVETVGATRIGGEKDQEPGVQPTSLTARRMASPRPPNGPGGPTMVGPGLEVVHPLIYLRRPMVVRHDHLGRWGQGNGQDRLRIDGAFRASVVTVVSANENQWQGWGQSRKWR